jgi:hypothetical protein
MASPKSPSPSILTKVYEEDALMLDRVSALALLEHWDGDWDGRPSVIRNLLAKFLERLPADSRNMLIPTETPA